MSGRYGELPAWNRRSYEERNEKGSSVHHGVYDSLNESADSVGWILAGGGGTDMEPYRRRRLYEGMDSN